MTWDCKKCGNERMIEHSEDENGRPLFIDCTDCQPLFRRVPVTDREGNLTGAYRYERVGFVARPRF